IWPGEAAIDYQLGLCEEAAGCPDRALAAWTRIAPGSPFTAKAARARDELLRQLHDRGRFADLEEVLDAARRGTGPVAAELGQALAGLRRYEGRFDEVKRLLRIEWARAADPARTLRDLWMLDAEPVPVEMVRGVLDQAASLAPDDDRVWLGRANLATWSGRLAEADRGLVACLDRRPRDPAVWRARLEWARAAGRVDVVEQALANLPADWLDPEVALEFHAWVAGQRGDRDAERLALE